MARRSTTPVKTSTTARLLRVGPHTVAYKLTRANRKTIGITIRPDMTVEVRAPRQLSDATLDEVIQQRSKWLLRHLDRMAQRPPRVRPSTRPQNGSYLLLGQPTPITVMKLDSGRKRESVAWQDGALIVHVTNLHDEDRIANLLEKWSRTKAEAYYTQRLNALFCAFDAYALPMPTLKLRKMHARWGSCSSRGTITLNTKLIHLDPVLIDYVIMHELCHLIEHNHSKRFYAHLARMMPDWDTHRQRLNDIGMPE